MPIGVYKRIKGNKYGMSGKKHTNKTKRKIGLIHLGKKQSPKLIAKRVKGRSWYKPTEEHKKKIGISNSKEKIKKECLNCLKIFYVSPSLNTRKYCSKECGNKKPSPRYWLGKKRSLEDRKVMSLRQIGKTPWNKNKKGVQVAWNKGTKGVMKPNSTSFKKGRIGRVWSVEERKKHSIMKVNNPPKVFQDTKIELLIEEELIKRKIKYKKQFPLCNISTVDFYLPEHNTVIQADGCYWHGCEEYKHKINKKITKNMTRDKYQNKVLLSQGYKLFRFWEHEINKSPEECVDKVLK